MKMTSQYAGAFVGEEVTLKLSHAAANYHFAQFLRPTFLIHVFLSLTISG